MQGEEEGVEAVAMASVYQTQEWRQGGGPPGQEHPLHTDLGGGSRRRGIRDLNSSRVQLDWAGGGGGEWQLWRAWRAYAVCG